MPRHPEQLAHILRETVARFLLQDVEFEKGALVTVTRAEIAGDGRAATVFISTLPETYGGRALRRLKPHLYDLQGRINVSLGRRHAPRIRLALDSASALRPTDLSSVTRPE